MVIAKFRRTEVMGVLEAGETEVIVSGELTDGTRFEGTDTVRVIDRGRKKGENDLGRGVGISLMVKVVFRIMEKTGCAPIGRWCVRKYAVGMLIRRSGRIFSWRGKQAGGKTYTVAWNMREAGICHSAGRDGGAMTESKGLEGCDGAMAG